MASPTPSPEPDDLTVRIWASAQGHVEAREPGDRAGRGRVVREIFRIPHTEAPASRRVRARTSAPGGEHTDGPLTEVKVDSVAIVATDPEGVGLATVEERTGEGTRRLTGDLGTEGRKSIDFADYRVEAEVAGTVRVVMAVSAVDLGGSTCGR